MDIVEVQKKARVYSKDKKGHDVLIPMSRYSVCDLLQKKLIHRIEIDSNDISIDDLITKPRGIFKYPLLDLFPEVIYGEDVDSPKPFAPYWDILVIKSIVFKTNKNLSLCNFFNNLHSLIKIQHFSAQNIVNTSGMFSGCGRLKVFPKLDTSKVTDMSDMFARCHSMLEAPVLDTAMVSNMSGMFANCSQLKNTPNYVTDNVVSVSNLYNGCSSLKGKIKVSNLLSCKDAKGMFNSCTNVEELELLHTDNITDYTELCCECTNLKKITISSTRGGEKFCSMFRDCCSLESVSIFDFSAAIDCERMFLNCKKLKSFIAKNSNKLENIQEMFADCLNLQDFNLGDYKNVKLQTNAFLNCSSIIVNELHMDINQLPKELLYQKLNIEIDSFGYFCVLPENLRNINLRSCKDIRGSNLETILLHKNLKYVELPKNVVYEISHESHGSSRYDTDYNLEKLLYIDPIVIRRGKFTYSVSKGRDWNDDEYTEHYYEPSFDTYKFFRKTDCVRNRVYDDFIKSHGVVTLQEGNIFYDSYRNSLMNKVDFYVDGVVLEDHNQNKLLSLLISNKIQSIVIKDNFVMLDVIFGTDEIEELPLIVISKGVVSCRGLFSDLRKLKKIESISFLSTELEDLTAMFLNCEALVSVPPLKFSNVTVLDYIFSGCISMLKSPDISWLVNSEESISMYRAFENCKELKSVYGIELNGRIISDIGGIFYHCFSLSSFMPLNIANDLSAYGIFYDAYDYKDVNLIEDQIEKVNNDLVKKMLLDGKYSEVYQKYALEYEVEFSSIDELLPCETTDLGFVKGIIDGTNPKYGIFVQIPSKQTIGLIHVSKLNPNQKSNLSNFKKGGDILVKIIRERNDHKLELDFFD